MITDREQIHDLAKLTGCQIVKNVCGNPMFTMTTYELQQYTELIVRECATAIIQDSRLNDVRSAANGCVRTIREHFGVEE